MEMNMDINVNGLILRIHPVYNQYSASRCGKVVNIDSEAILLGTPSTSSRHVLNNNLSNFQLEMKGENN